MVKLALMEMYGLRGGPGAYLRLVRPKQWTKNGFVLAGLVFSGGALQSSSIVSALLAFAAFCALSGSIYAANDAMDVDEDRKHPRKQFRPVASGEISVRAALIYAALLAVGGLAVSFYINVGVGLAGSAYLLLQILYTTVLKHLALLDVMSIAGGFVLRALAGVAAVESRMSPWLIVCTGLLALFLGFSKRRYEITSLGEEASAHRKNLADYSVPMLDEMMTIVVAATVIAYTLYTFTAYPGVGMMLSIPFVIYGIFRYMLLVHRDGGGNPDTLLLRDRPLQITLLLWLIVVISIIYFI